MSLRRVTNPPFGPGRLRAKRPATALVLNEQSLPIHHRRPARGAL